MSIRLILSLLFWSIFMKKMQTKPSFHEYKTDSSIFYVHFNNHDVGRTWSDLKLNPVFNCITFGKTFKKMRKILRLYHFTHEIRIIRGKTHNYTDTCGIMCINLENSYS